MSASVRRRVAAGAVGCALSLLALAYLPFASGPPAPKPVVPPVPAQNLIVVPSPDQVTDTIDASDCLPPKTEGLSGHTMAAALAPPYALLLATPLAAAVYAQSGMSGVARLYGC